MAEPLRPLQVLIVEDSEEDMVLILHALRRGGYDPLPKRVERAKEMAAALATGEWEMSSLITPFPNGMGWRRWRC